MFSRRTQWDLDENPLSLEQGKLQAKGVALYDLTGANPTRAGIVYPPQLILPALAQEANLTYTPDPRGLLPAREAVSRYYARQGVTLPPERIILTASSSEAYTFLFRLLADPHERVLLPAPSYPLFAYLAGLNDVEVAYYRLYFNGQAWRIDFDALAEAADRGAKAVVLVGPNNPTGSCLKADEWRRLNEVCAEYGLAIISDEVFSDYLFDAASGAFRSLAGNASTLTFTLGGLSKSLGLPQMKLGWIAVNGPADQVRGALERLEVIADTYLSVNTPVQNAAASWLDQGGAIRDQIMARLRANYGSLSAAAKTDGVAVLPVEGGWYAVLKAELGMPEEEWALRLLRQQHLIVHPGFFFDFDEEGYIVVSLLTAEDVFSEGTRRLLASLTGND